MDPIIFFVQGETSPPPAPKHKTAAAQRVKKAKEVQFGKKRVREQTTKDSTELVTEDSFKKIRKRPVNPRNPRTREEPYQEKRILLPRIEKTDIPTTTTTTTTTTATTAITTTTTTGEEKDIYQLEEEEHDPLEKTYAQRLLAFFISGHQGIPSFLIQPPASLDLNVIIDEEGHTSLHWAAAMAHLKMVQLLVQNKADMCRVNYIGQTALMRSVLFTSNFEQRSFDSLLSYLRPIVFNIDENDQTVFHHIAATSGYKGQAQASRYYMECLIHKLKSNRSELISILNVQDAFGDTALSILDRLGNKRLMRLLMNAGASREITNEEGISPQLKGKDLVHKLMRKRVKKIFGQVTDNVSDHIVPAISEVFDSFAESYEKELLLKETALERKREELELNTKRLEESKRTLESAVLSHQDTMDYEEQGLLRLLNSRFKKWLAFSQKKTLECLSSFEAQLTDGASMRQLMETTRLLRQELASQQHLRKERVKNMTDLLSRSPSKRYQDYKRLISTSCNISYDDVELMLGPLLASFEKSQN
ncbi:hypothetical protein G6F56_009869 [Rhizopus delemar]|nr:hypothetical protein G6F56_009869 [Rhizopus delemar]